MKGLTAGLKVGLLSLLVAGFGFWMWKTVGERASGSDGYTVWAHFKDAQGLASKSRVVVAGITVGEIVDRRLDGRFAKVTVRLQKRIVLYENAVIFKKSSSLLGEFYLEIDPGTPTSYVEGKGEVQNRVLQPGDQIKNVAEATSTDDIMRQVGETLPKVDRALDEIALLVADTRKIVNNEIASIARNIDKAVEEDAALVNGILKRADAALADIQVIVRDVRTVTGAGDEKVLKIIDNLEAATAEAKLLITEARAELAETGKVARDKLDKLDQTLENLESVTGSAASVGKKIDGDQGTLGKLVNDPTIANNIEDITTSAKGFTDSLFGLQTIVGIRGEYNFLGKNYRSYVSLEARTRTDKFYLIELVSDPKGELDESFEYDEASGQFVRTFRFDNGFRFTFQFGKRWNWLGLRLGIKDSSGGVGADVHLFGDSLRMSLDVFDFTYYDLPRVKFWAAYRFARYLYVYAGVDDLLHEHEDVPIVGDTITGEEYTNWTFGLDFFAGTMLEFNDEDLTALLFLAGGGLSAAVGND